MSSIAFKAIALRSEATRQAVIRPVSKRREGNEMVLLKRDLSRASSAKTDILVTAGIVVHLARS